MKTIKTIILSFFLLGINSLNAQSIETTKFEVEGNCGMCKTRIEKAALINGVTSAIWDSETQLITLKYDKSKVNILDVHQKIAAVGHDTKKVKAPNNIYENLPGCCLYRVENEPKTESVSKFSTTQFTVNGICEMCKERIEKTAKIDGVKSARWDIDSQILTLEYDKSKVDLMKIHKLIAKVGHDTEKITASAEAYDNLHGCCKYRDREVINEHKTEEVNHVILKGKVFMINENGKKESLLGANLIWKESLKGISTDLDGNFSLEKHPNEKTLVVSFVGMKSQTISITNESEIEIVMSDNLELREFEVIHRRKSIEISKFETLKIEGIGQKELAKAACCNLSESFETNPSVDVSFTDAVTGTKQIKMLGLSGANISITKENMPDVRGFASLYGLTFIPGDWIESIQLIKGTGSVVNGYESITGQINVELKKPEGEEKLHLNLYGNQAGRLEMNANFKTKLSDKWSTAFLLHQSQRATKTDNNKDGFLDNPLSKNFIGMNRWRYKNDSTGLVGQIGVEGVSMNSTGGQLDYKRGQDIVISNPWGAQSEITRLRAWGKIGKVFLANPGRSVGLQLSATTYDQKSIFGLNKYNAKQNSGYANLIFQDIINTTDNIYKIGASLMADEYLENVNANDYSRTEITPGVFGEYAYSGIQNLKAVIGLRADYNSLYGAFVTPRLHLKYDFNENSILRASAGRGQRTANIFSENLALFSTSRNIVIKGENPSSKPYGLDAEIAWNYGLNYGYDFKIANRDAMFSVDLYHTNFENQIVADWENPDEISFYNLNGKSYSNSLQVQFDYEIIENLDVRIAYRYYDIKTTFEGELLQKQLTAPNRAFINLGYETKNKWNFDFTLNWIDKQRVPSTESNPVAFQLANESPAYFLANAQISKKWDRFSIYFGAENLFNFKMDNPILDSKNPYGSNFDSSLIWGPIFGRNIYGGIRFTLK